MNDTHTKTLELTQEANDLNIIIDNEKMPSSLRLDASVRKRKILEEINDILDESIRQKLD